MIICEFCQRSIVGQAQVVQIANPKFSRLDDSEMIKSIILHEKCIEPMKRKLEGLIHECPKCKTKGQVAHPQGRTQEKIVKVKEGEHADCAYNGCMGCHMCGKKRIYVPVMIECDLCSGKGWLKEEPKPVIDVVGYELDGRKVNGR